MPHIFDRAKPEDLKDRSIGDIKKVLNHYMENGILRYNVLDKKDRGGLSFSMDTCYSTELYYLVWDYLFMDVENRTEELARATKIYEVYKFINNFKNMLDGEVILSQAISDRTAHRKSKDQLEKIKYVIVTDMSTPTRLFKDCHGIPGVIVTIEGVDRAYELSNFSMFCSEVFFKTLKGKYDRKEKHIINDFRSMGIYCQCIQCQA